MVWKNVRLVFFSFLAGVLIMGGVWIGNQNNEYFSSNHAFAENNQNQDNSTVPVANIQTNPITSGNIIAEMVKKAGPAVVRIETTSKPKVDDSMINPLFRDFFGNNSPFGNQSQESSALGSGFIIDSGGTIVTNNHVIEGADSIQVFVSGYDKPFSAKVLGRDPELDLAVLKMDTNVKFPFLKLGNSDTIEVGEWSVAIGNPFGLDHTVTVGVISAKGRPLTINRQNFKDLLQTDTSINPGNSGGPLLNLDGEVIGINTAINAEGQGLGFAIPINTAKEVLDELINKGKVSRPWVGIGVQDINDELAQYFGYSSTEGSIIGEIYADSPAEKAGLQRGDIVVEIDGKKIKNSQDLIASISGAKVGDRKKILIWRSGKLQTIEVKIGEKNV